MEYSHNFIIDDIPGKGKGVISQRHISKGEIVLAESPLFIQSIERGNSTVLAALAQCAPAEQRQFYDLHNCHADRYPAALGIFETNVLPCGGNDAHGHVAKQGGVFLLASRFNSSCVPNLNNHWDSERRQVIFRAVRDVAPGEELCIGYGRLLAKRDERREELRRKFRFECHCEACALEGAELAESDARRECLSMLYHAHMQAQFEDPVEGIGEAMLALQFLREENLPVYESSFYFSGFHICATVSDYRNASAWATKAREASGVAFGHQNAAIWKQYIRDPQSYPEAGTSVKRTLAAPDSAMWGFLGL